MTYRVWRMPYCWMQDTHLPSALALYLHRYAASIRKCVLALLTWRRLQRIILARKSGGPPPQFCRSPVKKGCLGATHRGLKELGRVEGQVRVQVRSWLNGWRTIEAFDGCPARSWGEIGVTRILPYTIKQPHVIR